MGNKNGKSGPSTRNKLDETTIEDETVEGEDEGDEVQEVAAAPKVKLSAAQEKALFEAYEAAESKIEDAKATIETLTIKKGEAVKAIKEAMGPGPFAWKGSVIRVVQRGQTHFMKGRSTVKREVRQIG